MTDKIADAIPCGEPTAADYEWVRQRACEVTDDVPEAAPTWKLKTYNAQQLRNAIRDIIYKSFDNEAETVANIIYAVRYHDG